MAQLNRGRSSSLKHTTGRKTGKIEQRAVCFTLAARYHFASSG